MRTDGIELGIKQHEEKGAQFLEDLGLPDIITEIARNHVNAKRYLCFKNSDYYNSMYTIGEIFLYSS